MLAHCHHIISLMKRPQLVLVQKFPRSKLLVLMHFIARIWPHALKSLLVSVVRHGGAVEVVAPAVVLGSYLEHVCLRRTEMLCLGGRLSMHVHTAVVSATPALLAVLIRDCQLRLRLRLWLIF